MKNSSLPGRYIGLPALSPATIAVAVIVLAAVQVLQQLPLGIRALQ
ncbi:hypothetical protein SAMN04515620_102189 [Collimonas sp. OK607]|nr:hypothetical protein SAMN04515620_102189 [Collimonas sp. OK607]